MTASCHILPNLICIIVYRTSTFDAICSYRRTRGAKTKACANSRSTKCTSKTVAVFKCVPCREEVRGYRYSSTYSSLRHEMEMTSASSPGRFTHGTHWIDGWVVSRAGPDVKGKIPVGNRTLVVLSVIYLLY